MVNWDQRLIDIDHIPVSWKYWDLTSKQAEHIYIYMLSGRFWATSLKQYCSRESVNRRYDRQDPALSHPIQTDKKQPLVSVWLLLIAISSQQLGHSQSMLGRSRYPFYSGYDECPPAFTQYYLHNTAQWYSCYLKSLDLCINYSSIETCLF